MLQLSVRDFPWDEGMHGWIVEFIRANLWRVKADYTFEDMLQQAALAWCKLDRLRPHATPQERMAAMKFALSNEFNGITARYLRKGRKSEVPDSTLSKEESVVARAATAPPCLSDVEWSLLCEECPDLAALYEAVIEDEAKPKRGYSRNGVRGRETTENYLSRLARERKLRPRLSMTQWLEGLLGVA